MNKIAIIPLGGLGTRFKSAGYILPKPLINVMGQPILYWLLENLDLSKIEYIYIPYNKELKKYRFEDQIINDFPDLKFKFYCLEHNTRGAAETIKISLDHLNETNDKHVVCIDSDNFYTENFLSSWNGENMVVSFEDYFVDPIFSYVKINKEGRVIDIKEKCKISNNACCGVYAFNSLYKLLSTCNYIISNGIMEKNEFYMSVVIKQLIEQDDPFYCKQVDKNNYHCLGTPFQVKIFCNNFKRLCTLLNKTLIKPKRYCFDLDNTLVTFPKNNNDYTTVEPILQNIKMVQYLKSLGHTIIISTARRMKTHNSNVGKILADIGKITFETLDKFNIPYDEIYFGKPQANYYIDDLAISSYDNLEKAFGYHQTDIEPRDHNTIEGTTFETIKKKSSNLDGEIHYYKNIPTCIQNLFPILVNYDIDNTWYQIEKIKGISISKLYLSEEMTPEILKNIMNTLQTIQNLQINYIENINIYANYCNKIKKRYDDYDYSKFRKSQDLYLELVEKMASYEMEQKGIIKMIHGDPVLTNIILDQYNKLKFIDMRGKLGKTLTICGDWLYDWAKLYQSLIGYDEILDNVDIDITYKNNMITIFREEFLKNNTDEDFENLKLITKSLLFTLIPLHNNTKCNKYYELIYSPYLQ